MNEAIEFLENRLTYKITKKGCRTIAAMDKINNSYFFRPISNDMIEVCGVKDSGNGKDVIVFRYNLVKNDDEEMEAWLAWNVFRDTVKDILGVSFNSIVGGLPKELHQYRDCVPSPVNWCDESFAGEVVEGCVKADICSAYGEEGSKTLPDCHPSVIKVVDGKVSPTEEFPFAFYLESGELEVWGEGRSQDQKNSQYMKGITRWVDNERTLLCPAAKTSLRPVFEWFYDNRKEHPEYKFVPIASIGMCHTRRFSSTENNLWPIAAVIKFRCNKRIIDMCDELYELRQLPLLINTDSITWRGQDLYKSVSEKKLGNFALEYSNCKIVYNGPKVYQIDTGEGVLTRWSGPHSKKYTEKLPFGAITQEETKKLIREQENRNQYKWDWLTHRFINKLGLPITKEDIYNEAN